MASFKCFTKEYSAFLLCKWLSQWIQNAWILNVRPVNTLNTKVKSREETACLISTLCMSLQNGFVLSVFVWRDVQQKKPHHLGKLRDSGKELKEAYLLIQGKWKIHNLKKCVMCDAFTYTHSSKQRFRAVLICCPYSLELLQFT